MFKKPGAPFHLGPFDVVLKQVGNTALDRKSARLASAQLNANYLMLNHNCSHSLFLDTPIVVAEEVGHSC